MGEGMWKTRLKWISDYDFADLTQWPIETAAIVYAHDPSL